MVLTCNGFWLMGKFGEEISVATGDIDGCVMSLKPETDDSYLEERICNEMLQRHTLGKIKL